MEYRKLGGTNLSISSLCLGSMTWGEQNTESEGHAQLDMALDAGINFVDTAEVYAVPAKAETYGRTEEIIGSWLKKTGRRGEIILASKVAGPGRTDLGHVRPEMGGPRLDKASIFAAVEASLKRLQTDYLDLYQVHWPGRASNFFGALRYKHRNSNDSIAIEETLDALTELVKAGKVRHIGISNETPWGMAEYLRLAREKDLAQIRSIQNPYSLLNRSFEVGLAEMSIRENVGLLAYSILGFGMLSGKYRHGAKPAGARLTLYGKTMKRYSGARSHQASERYVALAEKWGMHPAQMATAFVVQQPFVTSAIIGATSTEQLDTLIKSQNITLTEELLTEIDRIDDEITFPAP